MTPSPYLHLLDPELAGTLPAVVDDWHRLPFADIRSVRWPRPDAGCRVVVLHGGGGNASAMAPIAALAYAAGADVVVPDLPGYGATRPTRPGRVTYEQWVATGRALVARDERPVVIVGLSIGGMLAYDIAAASSTRVSAVVATCLLDPARDDVRAAVSRTRLMGRLGPAVLNRFPVFDSLRVPIAWTGNMRKVANDSRLVDLCLSDRTGAGSRVALGFLRTWMASRRPMEPEEFSMCPVVLAHPAEDRWTPPTLSTAFLSRVAGRTELHMLDGAGHFPVERPGVDQLAGILRRIISETASTAGASR